VRDDALSSETLLGYWSRRCVGQVIQAVLVIPTQLVITHFPGEARDEMRYAKHAVSEQLGIQRGCVIMCV
jgi:hypothetical protein